MSQSSYTHTHTKIDSEMNMKNLDAVEQTLCTETSENTPKHTDYISRKQHKDGVGFGGRGVMSERLKDQAERVTSCQNTT